MSGLLGMVSFLQDITLRAKMEDDLNALYSSLEEANRQLARNHERLTEMDRIKSEFFANISHELRTPLTLMIGPLEMLLKGEVGAPDAVQRLLETTHANALRLLRLINNLLDFARIESGQMLLQKVPVDLAEWLPRLVETVAPAGFRQQLAIHFRPCPHPLPANIDCEKMERVILNLLSNALKFTPAGGAVEVHAAAAGGHVRIEVRDTGIGIDPSHHAVIFERFRQVDGSASRRYSGTGLGLSLAREIVALHGGSIEVHSVPHVKTTFVVEFPAGDVQDNLLTPPAREDPIPFVTLSAPIRAVREQPSLGGRKNVMIVDDNAELVDFLRLSLESEFDVFEAVDGHDALEKLDARTPHLIIADVMMPRLNGYELCSILKDHAVWRHIPIILLTARADTSMKIEGLQRGADDYMTKPFNSQELLVRVRSLLKVRGLERELARRNLELQHASNELRAFAFALSEELSNPIRRMHGFARALLEDYGGQLDGEGQEYLKWLKVSSEKVMLMVDGLLSLSRIACIDFRLQRVDLSALARSIAAELAASEPQRHVEFVIADGLEVEADEALLRVALENLMGNAWKFTRHRQRARIQVGCMSNGADEVAYFVRDDGVGFDMSHVGSRLFSPFQKLYSTDDFASHGIGLAAVQRAVLRHGGRLWAESTVDQGASFFFTLQ